MIGIVKKSKNLLVDL